MLSKCRLIPIFINITLVFLLIILLPSLAKPASEDILDTSIKNLVQQISQSMTAQKKTKIAVVEFQNLFGPNTEFERFLTEELITRLFQTGKFRVIERTLLNKVLEEQKLSTQDIFDPANVKNLGRILGVDGIVTGTVADMGDVLKVNARLISTETGDVFAAAGTDIIKDRTVLVLRGEEIPKEMLALGSILINCEVDGTEVYLNDNHIGKTKEGKLFIPNVIPDRYILTLKKEGFINFTKTLVVNEGAHEEVNISAKVLYSKETAVFLSLLFPGAGSWYLHSKGVPGYKDWSTDTFTSLLFIGLGFLIQPMENPQTEKEKEEAAGQRLTKIICFVIGTIGWIRPIVDAATEDHGCIFGEDLQEESMTHQRNEAFSFGYDPRSQKVRIGLSKPF